MSDVKAVLKKARALIDIGWTKGTYARNQRHEPTAECSRAAICWCVYGALIRASSELHVPLSPAIDILYKHLEPEYGGLADFNDAQPSKKPVLALFDRALEKLDENIS